MRSAILVALCGCYSLGPVASTTAVSAVPAGRPGVEAQAGFVPGFKLSDGARHDAHGEGLPELAALVDLDRWLAVPGLVVGARVFGSDKDTPGEPMIGYRRTVTEDVAIAVIAFATAKRSTNHLATYHATQGGAEAAVDGRLVSSRWLALHAQGAVSTTALSGTGTYCVDGSGIAVDCDINNPSSNTMVDGKISGLYPAATATLALDIARRPEGVFHGARIAALGTAGMMPFLTDGRRDGTRAYATIGLTLTLGFGAADGSAAAAR